MNGMDIIANGTPDSGSRQPLVIGIVNNMPIGGRAATERQFREILRTAAGDREIRLRCYSPGAAVGGAGDADIEEIFEAELDGLIVTGAEPQASDLRDEWIWPIITRLVDWAESRAMPTVWSCLAAHAAVFYLDKIDRVPLAEKLSGVFAGEIMATEHPLMRGLARDWSVPHSRCNDLPEDALLAGGYTVLVRSDQAGVDLFEKSSKAPFLFLQGHPEYEAENLLREFQRDVRRYHAGERSRFPSAPRNYFPGEVEALVTALREAACPAGENGAQLPALLSKLGGAVAPSHWGPTAVTLFGNWLSDVARRKESIDPAGWAFEGLSPHFQASVEMSLGA